MATAKSTKSEKIILALNPAIQNSPAIKEAVTIANSLLKTTICLDVFNEIFEIDKSMQDKLNGVFVLFYKYPNPRKEREELPLAWTVRNDDNFKDIYINDLFEGCGPDL